MTTTIVRTWLLLWLPFLIYPGFAAAADKVPPGLPRYHLDIKLDLSQSRVKVREHVTWTNRHHKPTKEVVLNVHSHYAIPDEDIGLLAKTVEILRLAPSEALSFDGPACEIVQVREALREPQAPGVALAGALGSQETLPLLRPKDQDTPTRMPSPPKEEELPAPREVESSRPRRQLQHRFRADNATALVISLPRDVGPGESVAFDVDFNLRLPRKMGRWGTWEGVTVLAQWLPVAAYYDDQGWQPTPFIPWHQPYFSEAGTYTAKIVLPAEQKLACTGSIESDKDLGNGWRELCVAPVVARDFSMVCSDRFQEHTGEAPGADASGSAIRSVRVRCLALPEHEFYAKEMVKVVCDALPTYQRWFGPYPYPEFDIVEAYFGWNGNECGGMVMIDQRIFCMPHAAHNYVDYLVSHELCHQWWYNVVGTNGYAETWMDEGLATYFSHRFISGREGDYNELIKYPAALSWMPNIRREDFRNYGMLGVVARGDAMPVVQPMEKFDNLVNLMGMTYDRGSRIVGMIGERLGEANFFDFMRHVYKKYQFQVLRVADFQRALEEYTGQSWHEFFQHWLYGTGMSDWGVDRVELAGPRCFLRRFHLRRFHKLAACGYDGPVQATVFLSQHGECNEPTILGFRFHGDEGFHLRVPIYPNIAHMDIEEIHATIDASQEPGGQGKTGTRVRVDIQLPRAPEQVTVDPDHILIDSHPCNNNWKPECRWRFTPLFTQLEETDVTNYYDRWNFIFGPWVYGSAYTNPWFTRSPMAGLRAGAYRTQLFDGGAYLAYRTNDRNIIAGVDGLWDHWPWPDTQLGFTAEQKLVTLAEEDIPSSRAVLFGRYVLLPSSSLYLPPFEHVEVFASIQNRNLPLPQVIPAGANLFNRQTALGLHYHKYMLTPYWDPEGGMALDLAYEGGLPVFKSPGFNLAFGQVSWVKTMPGWLADLRDGPAWNWLMNSRWAFRLNGAVAVPDNGLFFAFGGGDNFRGFDLSQRQGAATWVASAEWRVPVLELNRDFCDHFARLRKVYLAPFYDAGNAYFRWRPEGPIAHAVGLGLRLDVTWIGVIERTMLRLDVAKTVNADAPVQFWLGVQHPF